MATIIEAFIKEVEAELDYTVDWTPWLASPSDTISASTWTVPAELTANDEVHDSTTATVWLGGGQAGARYTVTNLITTASGRTDERSITIQISTP